MTHPNQTPSPSDIRQEDVRKAVRSAVRRHCHLVMQWPSHASIADHHIDDFLSELRAALSAQTGEPVAADDLAAVMWEGDHDGHWSEWGDGQDESRKIYLANCETILRHFEARRRPPPQPDTAPSPLSTGEMK